MQSTPFRDPHGALENICIEQTHKTLIVEQLAGPQTARICLPSASGFLHFV